jgi:hypothetical protein
VVLRVWQFVLLLYGAATLVASLAIARRDPRMLPWALPVVFPILHLSYGLGFLFGLIRFAVRRDSGKAPPSLDGTPAVTGRRGVEGGTGE